MKGEDHGDDELVVIGSDAESDGCAVVYSGDDASGDEDDVGSDASSGASVSELKAKYAATFLRLASSGPATLATGGGPRTHNHRPPLWQDEYFTIADKEDGVIQARVRGTYYRSMSQGGMGSEANTNQTMAKQVHPHRFG